MNAGDLAYAIPGLMVVAGGLWLITDIVIDGARTWWMDRQVRHTKIVEGAGAGDRPRTAATPSTPPPFDWATSDPWLADVRPGTDVLAGGTDEEAALADIDRRFHAIVRGESARIHPSTGGAA